MLRITFRSKPLRPGTRVAQTYRCLTTQSASDNGFVIPIIDFGHFFEGNSRQKSQIAKQVLDGFTSSGFIYLSNTGIRASTVRDTFKWSNRFFRLPMEEKMKLAWETPESNRGYVAPGREKVSRLTDEKEIEKIRARAPDLKESLEIGKEPSDNYLVGHILGRRVI